MKYILIDSRIRKEEKEVLKNLGYALIELPKSNKTYPEISSHVDIFCLKIDNTLIVEKTQYNYIKSKINSDDIKIIERKKLYRF